MRLYPACIMGMLLVFAVLLTGCGEERFDPSRLSKGMDRSTIIAYYGTPDKRSIHEHAERLSYKDGKHYQYLLMLVDGKLEYWTQDRLYQPSRFSNIMTGEQASR